ncbi:MAG: hypothetical protein QXH77_05790, partial [Desulfurococcaceae archaeon]
MFLNALALAGKSKYILLDEPFESVDPARRVILLKKIVESSSIMILNTHLLPFLLFSPYRIIDHHPSITLTRWMPILMKQTPKGWES